MTCELQVCLQCVCFTVGRKRPRTEQKEQQEEGEDLTAVDTPKRRVIKLTSIKDLRTEITENAHKGAADKPAVYL